MLNSPRLALTVALSILAGSAAADEIGGTYVSASASAGGLATELQFDADGTVRSTIGAMIDTTYSVVVEKGRRFEIEIELLPGEPSQRLRVEVRGDVLIQRPADGKGKQKMERAPGGPTGENPIVGLWRWRHPSGAWATTAFTDDGKMRFRLPMRHETGTYRVEGDLLSITWETARGEEQRLRVSEGKLFESAADGTEQAIFRRSGTPAVTPRSTSPAGSSLERNIVRGEGLLERRLLLDVPGIGAVTDIRLADLDPSPGLELGVAGRLGAVLLDPEGAILRQISFGERRGRVEFVDVDGDGQTEYMDRGGGWQPVALLGNDGTPRWEYSPRSPPNDMAAGDLDGDGRLEFVVGCNGSGGVHLLREDGTLVWKKKDGNVWTVAVVDVDGDGRLEIVHTNASGEIRERDRHGTIQSRSPAARERARFSLYYPENAWAPSLLFRTHPGPKILLADLKGTVRRELPISVSERQVYGAWGSPVQWDADSLPFSAIVLHLRIPYTASSGGLYLLDSENRLVFEELLTEQGGALLARPDQEGTGQVLVVGTYGKVWEYRWVGAESGS